MKYSEIRGQKSEVGGQRPEVRACSALNFRLCLLVLLGVEFFITGQLDAAEMSPQGRQRILFLGDGDPLVIEFELSVGQQPFQQVWRAGLAEILKQLDKDHNGVLTREETDGPTIQPGQPAMAEKPLSKRPKKNLLTEPLLKTANLWDADTEPRDGQLTVDELAWFLSRQGQGAFQAEASPQSGAMFSPQVLQNNSSGPKLWNWLDEDENATLSREELRRATTTLRKFDLDADETISLTELEGADNPFFSARQSNQNAETPFYAVLENQSPTRVLQKLMQRYGQLKEKEGETNKATKPQGIALDTLQIPQAAGQKFDRDGNGLLDDFELRHYLHSPIPTVRIQVGLPKDEKAEPLLSGEVTGEKSSAVVKSSSVGTISILAKDIQIEIDANGLQPEALEQAVAERFKQFDFDNNGYLDQNEANRDLYFRNHFKQYDADGDGKLYPEEYQPPLAAAIRLARMQTRMVVQDAGQDLFSVLDSDRNLRISPREWLTAAERLSVWDKNENGQLETDEVPHVYRVSFGPGLPNLPGLITAPNNNAANASQPLVSGPKWFRAMDKNNDGDVSEREFLGKPELFRQIDQDNNQLIDPREAARFAE